MFNKGSPVRKCTQPSGRIPSMSTITVILTLHRRRGTAGLSGGCNSAAALRERSRKYWFSATEEALVWYVVTIECIRCGVNSS